MSRTRVRRRRIIVTVVAASLGAAWAGPAFGALRSGEPEPVASRRVVVQPGDTLWAIAERVAPGEDPRPLVDALVTANDVDPGALVPGQTLVLPTGVPAGA